MWLRKLALGAWVAAFAAPLAAQEVKDLPGPNMTITVAGEAGEKGKIVIDLLPDVAPKHVEQITALVKEGAYDGVSFHRVIDGFMAQTGDVQFGNPATFADVVAQLPAGEGRDMVLLDGQPIPREYIGAGMGGSTRPDLSAEFSNLSFTRGIVGMARSADPNSANSQFFIMLDDASHLDGQYTVVGRVIEGLDVLDQIKKGSAQANGAIEGTPDVMAKVILTE